MESPLSTSIEELKALIVANLDVMEFLDILGYELSDLVDAFEDEIEEQHSEFERAVR